MGGSTPRKTKKRLDYDAPALEEGTMTVEFVDRDPGDKAMLHLISEISTQPVYLVCSEHQAGDHWAQQIPHWFDGMVSLDGQEARQMQFVKQWMSHCNSEKPDGTRYFSRGEQHSFFRFRFVEHLKGLQFRCEVERKDRSAKKTPAKETAKKASSSQKKARKTRKEESPEVRESKESSSSASPRGGGGGGGGGDESVAILEALEKDVRLLISQAIAQIKKQHH